MRTDAKPVLVIGGGIAGMTAAVEAAEVGYHVVLVEKEAYLGGRVIRMHRYFPKMCPPSCGFEINVRRVRQNSRIDVYTQATVKEISNDAGDFRARIHISPRYITGANSPDDSKARQLTSERIDEFNYGMNKTRALYLPHDMAYPPVYVLDRDALSDADARILPEVYPYETIDLNMRGEEIEIDAGPASWPPAGGLMMPPRSTTWDSGDTRT
jgi:heterodisulfide reductase subunit A-like polyferredoxin